ncbi:MAG: hypothetical protein AAF493_08125 [Pseudomonadota bacterium]
MVIFRQAIAVSTLIVASASAGARDSERSAFEPIASEILRQVVEVSHRLRTQRRIEFHGHAIAHRLPGVSGHLEAFRTRHRAAHAMNEARVRIAEARANLQRRAVEFEKKWRGRRTARQFVLTQQLARDLARDEERLSARLEALRTRANASNREIARVEQRRLALTRERKSLRERAQSALSTFKAPLTNAVDRARSTLEALAEQRRTLERLALEDEARFRFARSELRADMDTYNAARRAFHTEEMALNEAIARYNEDPSHGGDADALRKRRASLADERDRVGLIARRIRQDDDLIGDAAERAKAHFTREVRALAERETQLRAEIAGHREALNAKRHALEQSVQATERDWLDAYQQQANDAERQRRELTGRYGPNVEHLYSRARTVLAGGVWGEASEVEAKADEAQAIVSLARGIDQRRTDLANARVEIAAADSDMLSDRERFSAETDAFSTQLRQWRQRRDALFEQDAELDAIWGSLREQYRRELAQREHTEDDAARDRARLFKARELLTTLEMSLWTASLEDDIPASRVSAYRAAAERWREQTTTLEAQFVPSLGQQFHSPAVLVEALAVDSSPRPSKPLSIWLDRALQTGVLAGWRERLLASMAGVASPRRVRGAIEQIVRRAFSSAVFEPSPTAELPARVTIGGRALRLEANGSVRFRD